MPATATTVGAALTVITPATALAAADRGRRMVRQGDVYAVETTPARDGTGALELPASHRWNPTTRYLTTHHPDDGRKHRPVHISWPMQFVGQLYGAASFTTD